MEDHTSLTDGEIWLLKERLWKAASEGHVDEVSQFSTHVTGDVDTLGTALYAARCYGQLHCVQRF